MGQPAARLGDMHVCPLWSGTTPHVGGPIVAPGCPTVLIGGSPAGRVGDAAVCNGPPDVVVQGSPTVYIGGAMAARIGDMTAHGGVIVAGCPTVLIGNGAAGSMAAPSAPAAPKESGLSTWEEVGIGVLVVAGALTGVDEVVAAGAALVEGADALGAAAGLIGEGAEAAEGGALLGEAAEGEAAGAAGEEAAASEQAGGFQYSPKKIGQTEPGAVLNSPELQAQLDGASSMTARSAAGYPDLSADKAATFMEDVRPWNGDAQPGTINRVIGSDESANGGFWQEEMPQTEEEWRGQSAVLNDWNGNGGYVSSNTQGMRGWIGTARPQISSDGTSVLPGGGQQIWVPPGSASPGPTMPTPWSL